MVPLVLKLESGAITPQFHVTFDDWFATVVADPSKFPDFDSPDWHALFGDSAYQYLRTNEDDEVQEVPPPTSSPRRSTSSDGPSCSTDLSSACSSCSGDSSQPFGATGYPSYG
jgi:hypothetical protein